MTGLALLLASGCFGGDTKAPAHDGVVSDDGKRGKRAARRGGGGGEGVPLSSMYAGDPCGTWNDEGGRASWSVEFAGKTYNVPLLVPTGAGKRKAVILLHGGGGSGTQAMKSTGYGDYMKGKNAILVAPDSVQIENSTKPGHEEDSRWNSGKYENGEVATFPRDDVAFLDTLAKKLRAEGCVDEVLVSGFSAGGAMANRWMCEGKDVPDALVSAAGTLMVPKDNCNAPPKPMRLYVGGADRRRDEGARQGAGEPSVPDTAAIWATHNGCTQKTHPVKLSSDTSCEEYEGCKSPVELCVVDGFPHAWPGGTDGDPPCQHDATSSGYEWFSDVCR